MIQQKPYALSCDRNSEPILNELKVLLKDRTSLLEIGAGTGQHAIFMAPFLPQLQWTLTDRVENHESIQIWLNDFPRSNVKGPIEYEIGKTKFPEEDYDVFFASNVLHMLSWPTCLKLFDDLASLPQDCLIIFYGAFNYNGTFTSESNKKFNDWLKSNNPSSGIHNFEDITHHLKTHSIHLIADKEMPTQNRLLIFQKGKGAC